MNDHDIVSTTLGPLLREHTDGRTDVLLDPVESVQCRCGWTGPRASHELHRVREPGLAGVADARKALEEGHA